MVSLGIVISTIERTEEVIMNEKLTHSSFFKGYWIDMGSGTQPSSVFHAFVDAQNCH